MTQKKVNGGLDRQLRQRAEELLRSRIKEEQVVYFDISELAHELEVHQAAIEIQSKELKAAQLELEKARGCYQNQQEFTPIASFILDKDNLICEVNAAGGDLLSISRSELIKSSFTRFIADDDENKFGFFKKRIMESKGKQICNLNMMTMQGKFFHAHLKGIVDDTDGRINLSVIDIDKRKDNEAALYCCLYDLGMIGVLHYNLNGLITDANDKFLDMVGYTREDLDAGRINWVKLTPPEYRAMDREAADKLLAKGLKRLPPYEKDYIRKNGSRVPVIIGPAIYDEIISEGVAFVIDISERKRAEQDLKKHQEQLGWLVDERTAELKQSEENFRNSIDSSPIGIRIATEDEQTLYVNLALLNMFGYESTGHFEMKKHYTKENHTEYEDVKEKCLERKIVTSPYEITIIRKDGEERNLLVHRRKIRWGGSMEYQLMYEDITEQKRAMDSLKALTQKVITVQEEERHVIARELHDQIGQSLSAINLLLQRAKGSTESEADSLVDQARKLVIELSNMASNLCVNLRPPMLDDLGLLDTIIWYLDRFRTISGIEVDFKHYGLKRKLDPIVAVTVYRIIQEALVNIARHADADQAAVKIRISKNIIHLEVRDNGHGFHLSDLPADMKVGITGMYERAELLGGSLKVESTSGKGTRVTAEIPLVKKVSNT